MKNITLKISDKILTNAEWHAVRAYVPTIYRVENVGACIVLPGASYNVYISEKLVIDSLFSTVQNSPAPNVGISESFVLRAMAIAQNPHLAIELLK